MRELDVLLNAFLDHEYETLAAAEKDAFARLLEQPDMELHGWLIGQTRPAEPDFEMLVKRIRAPRPAG